MSDTNQQLNLLKAQLAATFTAVQLEAQHAMTPLRDNAKTTKNRLVTSKLSLKAAKAAVDSAKQEVKDANEAHSAASSALDAALTSFEATFLPEQAALKVQISNTQKELMASRLASKKSA